GGHERCRVQEAAHGPPGGTGEGPGGTRKVRGSKFRRLGLAGLLFIFGASAQTLEQAESLWKQRRYYDANEGFRALETKYPQDARIKARYGHMMLERHQEDDAANLFGEALKIDKNNAQALLGLALLAADDYEHRAAELAKKALESDPKLLPAQE